jgi:hypothetical protein
MKYNRFALTQVGGMHIVYNRRGDIVDTIGSVKGRRNTGYVFNNHNQNNYDNDHNYSASNNSNDYYYKADGTKAKLEEKEEDK